MSLNDVNLIGRLGKDPEMRQTNNGHSVAKFTLATNRKWDGNEETTWHQIVCWGKTAELVTQYLTKGREVHISGRIQNGQYEKEGITRYTSEVVANRVTFLGSADGGNGGQRTYTQQAGGPKGGGNYGPSIPAPPADDDDIPF